MNDDCICLMLDYIVLQATAYMKFKLTEGCEGIQIICQQYPAD